MGKGKIVKENKEMIETDKIVKVLAIVFSIIAWILLILVCIDSKFTPASTSMTAAALFLIAYYYRNNKKAKPAIVGLGIMIILLLVYTLYYTISHLI